MTVAGNLKAIERRLRRLEQLRKTDSVTQASEALRAVWKGKGFEQVKLRSHLLHAREDGQSPLTQLVNPRGIALRFYLLAVFEAQCRLAVGTPWSNTRGLADGRPSWTDMIAVDGAYDVTTGTYMPDTKQGRTMQDVRLRQVQGALKTLEEFDPQRSLVTLPRAKNGSRRLYNEFVLMSEEGRGGLQTPHVYTVPDKGKGWNGHRTLTLTIPTDFFLNGWVQILNPSEIATWLVLRELSQYAPKAHAEKGVYLYGDKRSAIFNLKRDAWEDSCRMLRALGLIRYARLGNPAEGEASGIFGSGWDYGFLTQYMREQYEPYRYQLTDQGLAEDALARCIKELTLLRAEARPRPAAS
ncbi:hypothetical protein [Streptomyces jumonjinensis]|uniref:Uncharacterized protein n=1 Tax=Streptomyces jumonjinensis TaxID=1945 RepID=A0A646KSQ4_STRJU|nr:hypothetical protein [Streptomyces jumonjinensis]MQT05359.1 hypothetical protein [Streptomyces jumonjinensis]